MSKWISDLLRLNGGTLNDLLEGGSRYSSFRTREESAQILAVSRIALLLANLDAVDFNAVHFLCFALISTKVLLSRNTDVLEDDGPSHTQKKPHPTLKPD